jgi:hypothetical protein
VALRHRHRHQEEPVTRPHGRARYYAEACRCDTCKQANRDYERARTRRRAMERWGAVQPALVDSQPARDHLRTLAAHGIGYKRAAELAGISVTVAARLTSTENSRPARRVRPTTLAKLLAVQPHPRNARPCAHVPIGGTARKLRALVAIGWTQTYLAGRIGWTVTNLGRLLHTPGDRVAAGTWLAVDQVWHELQNTPGPSQRARTIAAAHRWAPPAAWDDIDNVEERPHTGTTKTTVHDRLDDLEELLDAGTPLHEAMARCGWHGTPQDLRTTARRHNRHDLAARLTLRTP